MVSDTTKDQIIEIAMKKGIIQAEDIINAGFPREYLSRMAKQGFLERVGHGLYQPINSDFGEHDSLITVAKRVPNGVFTLFTALRFHGVTTQNPYEIWIAVHGRSWKPKLDYPPLRYINVSEKALTTGVEAHNIEGVTVKVYSVAKTITDCFKFRNKIGIDVAIEALKDGWKEQRFTIREINHYAKINRVQNVIKPYLESLV